MKLAFALCLAAICGSVAATGTLRGRGVTELLPLQKVLSGTCDASAARTDCHIDGQQQCEAGGCCWSPVNPNPTNEPWCFRPTGPAPTPTPTSGVCNPANRTTDCKIDNQGDCESGGCCWKPLTPNPSNLPWCFAKSPPSPACSTSPQCNGHGSCTDGACMCDAGYATCGTPGTTKDCTVNTASDPANCGACGSTCPTGTGISASTCSAGKCKITCDAGYILCYGECVQGTSCASSAPYTPSDMALIEKYFLANINIGGKGGVVAGPSHEAPDYYYHWERDGAISMRELLKVRSASEVDTQFKAYIGWVHKVQFESDPNGIPVQGEPKYFLPDGAVFDKPWMRPQNDGPGLRTLAQLTFARMLLAAGQKDYVTSTIFPDSTSSAGVAYDLEYVMNNWSKASGDPWEEVRGQVFFDKFTMRKALLDGADVATQLGYTSLATQYNTTAAAIKANIQSVHWNPTKGIIMEVPETRELDSAVHLGFLYGDNEDGFLTPDSQEAQSSVAVLVSSFSSYSDFSINAKDAAAGIPGLLVGRYLHDTYNGGNPAQPGSGNAWILCTQALAEFYYRAASSHARTGVMTVSTLNRAFFQQAVSMSAWRRDTTTMSDSDLLAAVGVDGDITLAEQPEVFRQLHAALMLTGDGILVRVKHHIAPHQMHMTEQINKDNGDPQGCPDLTWSYGTAIGAISARTKAMASRP